MCKENYLTKCVICILKCIIHKFFLTFIRIFECIETDNYPSLHKIKQKNYYD